MTERIDPTLRATLGDVDSALLCVVLGCFVVNALLFPTLLRLWRAFFRQILRPRSDVQQAERTSSERVVMAISLVQTVAFEALALYCSTSSHGFASYCGLLVGAAALMIVQIAGYECVGFAFSSPAETRSWLRAFFASQSLLGYLLIIPALGALFYPSAATAFLIAAGVVYVACRILFYIKGFAFFYTSPASIFYFFLYLCTLEIVPLAVVWSLTGFFSTLF